MLGSTDSEGSTSSTNATEPTLGLYRVAYKKADDFCKEVQAFVSEAGIPAMNELRYAGYHLLGAINDHGSLVDKAELISAINHAKRACYEAGEAGILIALDQINAFKNDYKNVVVTTVVKNYNDIKLDAARAQQRIKSERDHASPDGTDYDDYVTHFKLLRDHCLALDMARDELNKLVRNEAKVARRWLIALLATILFGVAAIIYNQQRLGREAATDRTVVASADAMAPAGH